MDTNGQSKIRCAKCGELLSEGRAKYIAESNRPASCPRHSWAVKNEAMKRAGMWPVNWYGHSWVDLDGQWRYK